MTKTRGSKGRPVATAEQRARAGVLPPAPTAGPRLVVGPRMVVDRGDTSTPKPCPPLARAGFRLLPGNRPLAGTDEDTTSGRAP